MASVRAHRPWRPPKAVNLLTIVLLQAGALLRPRLQLVAALVQEGVAPAQEPRRAHAHGGVRTTKMCK